MVAGLVIVPIVSLVTPRMDKDLMDDMFSCYNKKVVVNATEALTSEEEA